MIFKGFGLKILHKISEKEKSLRNFMYFIYLYRWYGLNFLVIFYEALGSIRSRVINSRIRVALRYFKWFGMLDILALF